MAPDRGELVTEAFGYDGGRIVTVYVPPESTDAVVFVADGGWHISRLVEALQRANRRSTMIVGVHGLPDDDGRLHEYVPGFDARRFAAHEQFFVHDVGRWVAASFGVTLPAERIGVWGASLGGELALAMGLRHPDVYGAVFAASPGAGFQPPQTLPTPLPRVYLVAGRQEQFFLDNATRWADALRDADADVVMMQREGEHSASFWDEEFPLMVAWAFGA
jgi:enterochelin esterase-like enzyme